MLNKNLKKIEKIKKKVRVRIAPAPTGPLHIGTARTALFNFLFAKKEGGDFILRIEDTDIERIDPLAEKDIMENLKWLGIEWDEGPVCQMSNIKCQMSNYIGNFGPYRQSERLETYSKYLEKLLAENKAYYCFCSKEELEAQRQYLMSIGKAPIYPGRCANLSKEEVKKLKAEGKPSIIRFRVPIKKVRFFDLIRGNIEFDSSLIGDFAIAKDLATPLYNFAVVVDDFEMKISHIIRGEDHISNTPKQILLQEALGFYQPKYAHLPLILGPDRTKLSKRHGAIAISDYKKEGYLPEALINFMAFLGWNPGNEREIYSLASLIKEFSLERCQKSGAIFNIKRLDFLNGFYIRQKSIEKLTELCLPYLIEKGFIIPIFESKLILAGYGARESTEAKRFKIVETGEIVLITHLEKIVSIYQNRLRKLSEISELTDFFFKDKLDYDKDLLRWQKMTDKEIKRSLDRSEKILSKIKNEDFTKENLEKILIVEAERWGRGDRGYLLWPQRVALTGKKASASPFEIAEILGKEKTIKRIKEAKEKIK
jgi:nondiscriminating glutamyl-tRNA synthetase